MALLVADSGPLIALARLSLLWLPARLEREVLVTELVWSEVTRSPRPGELPMLHDARARGWLMVVPGPEAPDPRLAADQLDEGELSALTLALSRSATVLIDEQRGRAVAARCGLQVVGTLGLLLLARERRLVGALLPLVESLQSSGYFLSRPLIDRVLRSQGE